MEFLPRLSSAKYGHAAPWARGFVTAALSVTLIAFLAVLPARGAMAGMDPLDTQTLVGANPASVPGSGVPFYACTPVSTVHGTLDLMQVADLALCNNPQTQVAWINTKIAAAQLGISRGAWLPTLDLSANGQRTYTNPNPLGGSPATVGVTSVSLSLQYLLFDFGGRNAQVESDKQALIAADLTQDETMQSVLFATVQDYYDLLAGQEAVRAANESVKSDQAAYDAANARHTAGSALLSDVLQAKTALSQAQLTLTQAQGVLTTSRGTLANIMGLPADTRFNIEPISATPPGSVTAANLKELITQAVAARPDLAAAQANIKSAQASLSVAQSAGLPSLSFFADPSYSRSALYGVQHQTVYGLSLSVPLFSGFVTTYQEHRAQAELDSAIATRDQIKNQVSLDVFTAYTALLTAQDALSAAEDLRSSAQASAQLAIGQYKAGVGDILNVLSANAALISAEQQEIQSRYNLYIARASLAKAIGTLQPDSVAGASR